VGRVPLVRDFGVVEAMPTDGLGETSDKCRGCTPAQAGPGVRKRGFFQGEGAQARRLGLDLRAAAVGRDVWTEASRWSVCEAHAQRDQAAAGTEAEAGRRRPWPAGEGCEATNDVGGPRVTGSCRPTGERHRVMGSCREADDNNAATGQRTGAGYRRGGGGAQAFQSAGG